MSILAAVASGRVAHLGLVRGEQPGHFGSLPHARRSRRLGQAKAGPLSVCNRPAFALMYVLYRVCHRTLSVVAVRHHSWFARLGHIGLIVSSQTDQLCCGKHGECVSGGVSPESVRRWLLGEWGWLSTPR